MSGDNPLVGRMQVTATDADATNQFTTVSTQRRSTNAGHAIPAQ
jgi:hypothetical protein